MNADHDRADALDLLALGAAGALSEEEYRTLENLLASDPDLASEYAALQASAATLAEASSEAPPVALRASILGAIRDVEQLPAAQPPPTAVTESSVGSVPAATAHHARANVVPIHHRRWMIPATAAAAVVMLLVGGLLINRSADAPGDRMSAVLNDDRAVTVALSGELEGLRLVASESEGAAVLLGSAVDMPDDGMVFQLWAVHDNEKVGMATFTPAQTGEVAVVVEGTALGSEYAVTVEPAGGSEQPTSDPVAVSPGLA